MPTYLYPSTRCATRPDSTDAQPDAGRGLSAVELYLHEHTPWPPRTMRTSEHVSTWLERNGREAGRPQASRVQRASCAVAERMGRLGRGWRGLPPRTRRPRAPTLSCTTCSVARRHVQRRSRMERQRGAVDAARPPRARSGQSTASRPRRQRGAASPATN